MREISDALHNMVYSIPKGAIAGINLIRLGEPYSSLQQYFRSNQSLARFKNHEQAIYSPGGAENILNAFWATTTAYHHVRDWALKDPEAVALGKDWKRVVVENKWLRRAKDLANASKHAGLDYSVEYEPPRLFCTYEGLIHTLSDFYRTLLLEIDGETSHPADFLDNVQRAWTEELHDPLLQRRVSAMGRESSSGKAQ